MKRILMPLLTISIVVLLISTASAMPFVVSVNGTISSIPIHYQDDAGILADQGLVTGSDVSYSFLIDFDQDAYMVLNDGSIETYVDGTGSSFSSSIDYFYAELLSGTMIPEKDGGFYNDPSNAAEIHYGVQDGGPDAEWVVVTGSGNSAVRLDWPTNNNWLDGIITVGDGARIQCWGYDSFGNKSYFRTDVTVSEVSSTMPAPEPATILLLSLGFACITGIKSRSDRLR